MRQTLNLELCRPPSDAESDWVLAVRQDSVERWTEANGVPPPTPLVKISRAEWATMCGPQGVDNPNDADKARQWVRHHFGYEMFRQVIVHVQPPGAPGSAD